MVEQLDGKLLKEDRLYVLSGEEMKKNFACERAVPFNEAICLGNAAADIFGKEFVSCRVQSLHTTDGEYVKKVLSPLAPLFALPESVCFVFGEDMFCKINLLTLAAYLDKIGYTGRAEAVLLKDESDFFGEKRFLQNVFKDAYAAYETLVLQRRMPKKFPVFLSEEDAFRYLDYKNGGKIAAFIRAHAGEKDLLFSLLREFSSYGLGDTQYLEMIKRYK